MQKKFFERPYLSLLPFLFLYILLILVRHDNSLFGDEGRYLEFAHNLLNGFYSPPPPAINLWNGPGFPLYLAPFVALGLPVLAIKLFNAVLYYFTLLLICRTVSRFLDAKKSLVVTILFGCYYMPYKSLPHVLSETFTIFLIAACMLLATDYFTFREKSGNRRKSVLLALLLACLALTKVIFGHVYLVASIVFLVLFILTKNLQYKRSFFLMVFSLVYCLPYLFYTYSLTGRLFYWTNAGGMSLYWMSNPVSGEYGEWYNDSLTSASLNEEAEMKLQINHRGDYEEIHKYTGAERDDKFREYALRNVTEHPGKVFLNWLANWSRMFFNYPVSYTPLRLSTFGNMLANITLLTLLVYATILTWRRKFRLPFVFKFMLTIAGIYLLGSSLLSAYDRMFYVLIPVFACWISYCISHLRIQRSGN